MDVNADCKIDGAGVYCDVNVSPEYDDNVDADNNSKVNLVMMIYQMLVKKILTTILTLRVT